MTAVPEAVSAYLSELGRKGGASKSELKAATSRENGRKGGRPRKTATPGTDARGSATN